MKPIAAAACLLFATSLLQAQTTPTTTPADPKAPAPAVPAVTKDSKTAPAATKTAPAVKKEAELPKIPGTVINRPNGTFLSLVVADGNFKLSFYDKKHKLMAMDVTRATARWPNTKTVTPAQFRTVLNGSGTTLVGQHPVYPPYTFNVFLTLLQGEGDDAKAVENYTVAFKG
jgi:hypothetical protein